MSVTVQLMSGDIFRIKIWNGFNMGNLLYFVKKMIEDQIEKEINIDRILFYDTHHERIDFLEDDFIYNEDHFYVVVEDEDDYNDNDYNYKKTKKNDT